MNKDQEWLVYVTKIRNEHDKEIERLKNLLINRNSQLEHMMKESAAYQARKDILEEWLTELRDELKGTDVHPKWKSLITEINDLLKE